MKWLKARLSKVIQWSVLKWLNVHLSVVAQFYAYMKWGILILVGLPTIFLVMWKVPEWQVRAYHGRLDAGAISKLTPQELIQLQKDLITAENNARATLAQIVGGLVVLLGLYATFKNVRVAEEGKLTERFSKAVELLGSEKVDVRLGGIYALERIARDSLKDHWTVMEVLTAFVRDESTREYGRNIEGSSGSSIIPIDSDFKLREDIQAGLTVIGRRKWADRERPHQEINLMDSFLAGTVLFEAKLRGANLFKTNLKKSVLYKSNLSNAVLAAAVLVKANLSYANLDGAQFLDADLTGADLRNTTGLTWDQISEAKMNETTQLPPELEERRKFEFMVKSARVRIIE